MASTSGRRGEGVGAGAERLGTRVGLRILGSSAFRRLQLRIMSRTFVRAIGLGLEMPRMPRDPDERLTAFVALTAQGARRALAAPDAGRGARERLGRGARRLGRMLRWVPPLHGMPAEELVAALYRNIGIDFSGELPGEVLMGPCRFSRDYDVPTCMFMAAFDEGVMAGVVGEGRLAFRGRITQGAPHCMGRFTAAVEAAGDGEGRA